MGSGGPRGLQILLSGGSPVRGGFDSHPFPPSFVRVAAALAATLALGLSPGAASAKGTPAPAARTPVAADSTAGAPRAAAEDTLAHGIERRRPFLSSPTGVMLHSLLVPGWGQALNGSWFKAALVAGGETALGVALIRDSQRLSATSPYDPAYATLFDRRQREAWWLGGVVFLSMVDSYVDAHLKGFDVELGPEPSDEGLRVSARIAVP